MPATHKVPGAEALQRGPRTLDEVVAVSGVEIPTTTCVEDHDQEVRGKQR